MASFVMLQSKEKQIFCIKMFHSFLRTKLFLIFQMLMRKLLNKLIFMVDKKRSVCKVIHDEHSRQETDYPL